MSTQLHDRDEKLEDATENALEEDRPGGNPAQSSLQQYTTRTNNNHRFLFPWKSENRDCER